MYQSYSNIVPAHIEVVLIQLVEFTVDGGDPRYHRLISRAIESRRSAFAREILNNFSGTHPLRAYRDKNHRYNRTVLVLSTIFKRNDLVTEREIILIEGGP
jgi:hypothetical protein